MDISGRTSPELREYIARLERENQASNHRAQQAEEENARLEKEAAQRAQQAEKEIARIEKKAAQRTQQAEEETARVQKEAAQRAKDSQKTTLNTFLEDCHVHLSLPLRVRNRVGPISVLTSLTSPKGRYCPRRLKKWKDFDRSRQKIFDRLSAIYHPYSEPAPEPFPEPLHIKRLRDFVDSRQLTSENDLRIHERTNMEDMVTRIVNNIVDREELADEFDLGQGIAFQNHTNNLSDGAEEIQARLQDTNANDPMPKPTNADQISVVKRQSGGDTICFLIEYKSPFKLPKEVLRKGIRHGMDLEQEIINRAAFSTDAEKKFDECAEEAVAAVITQLYSYMLKAGIEYGYLSTGEVYLFLQIRYHEPDVVYYYMAEPNMDVDLRVDGDGALAFSAISQTLCFCLRACQSSRRGQQWRRDAKAKSLTWAVNTELVLAQMTPLQRKAEAPSSEYKPAIPLMILPDESSNRKASLRQPRVAPSRVSCDDDPVQDRQDPETSSDGEDANAESPSGRAKATISKATKATKHAETASGTTGVGHQHLPYCSHSCLRALAQRGRLDPQCPNYALHPWSKGLRHTIDAPTLRILLRNQLDTDMDNNCTPLNIQGARGALFKLTLASHGYTLLGKGTVRAFVPDLSHEGRIYRRLRTLQGTCVPVCLGNLDCIYPYYYDMDVEIVHFLLLSWGGVALNWSEYSARKTEIKMLEDRLRGLGVEHQDERYLNVLRDDDKRGQLMLIDFERATVSEPETTAQAGTGKKGTKLPLGEVSSNVPKKRHWEVDATGDVIGLKVGGHASGNELYHNLSI